MVMLSMRGSEWQFVRRVCRPVPYVLIYSLLVIHCPQLAFAVPRNPPPVFETEYSLPVTVAPLSNHLFAENFVIAGLYVLLIVIAGLAVHRWRCRKTLFCLAVISTALFGFYQSGCPCPVGMLQNITIAVVHPVTFVPWTVIILFLTPLLTALFFGRIFCSSVCPFGAVQELTAVKNWRVPDNVEQALGLLRYIYLGFGVFCVAVGLGYYICRLDPYVGFFRLGGLFPVMLFSVAVLVTGLFIGRPFCRFLCPYGALLGLCGSLAARKVSVTPGACTNCQLCKTVCPYNAILPPQDEPGEAEKRHGPRQLLHALAALPVLTIVFGTAGYYTAAVFAPWHNTVRTATLLYAEDQKLVPVPGNFPETHAVSQTGESNEVIYQQAAAVIHRFRLAGIFFGIWCGLVIGIKTVQLSLHRRRMEYEVDSSRCFACGRCFWYCPNQKNERVLMQDG